jgi:hypothetical protein
MTYDKEQYNNLLERLDPKYMAILDEVAQTYPYSVTKIKDELANNLFYMDLTYGCVMSLVTYLNLDIINMYTLSLLFSSSMYKDEPKQSVDNGIQERTEYMVMNGE